jgi:hypothetical protein
MYHFFVNMVYFSYFFELNFCYHVIEKANPVTGRGGPYGCETSRLPHFLDIGSQMAVRLWASRADRLLPPGTFLVLISVRD